MERKGTISVILLLLMILSSSFIWMKKKNYQQQVQEFKYATGYTPYELKLIYTKAHEGFSPIWYKDGFVKGKQSYSIGYGINDQGSKVNHDRINQLYTNNGVTTPLLASKAISDYYKAHEHLIPQSNIWKETAYALHFYNRGTPKQGLIRRCCGKKWGEGCGSNNKDIRSSHNNRRLFEKALVEKDIDFIRQEMQKAECKINPNK